MEDEGIMALPQGQAMQGAGTPPEMSGVSPEAMAAFEQARMQVSPVEFGEELLNQGEKADPATVAEFRRLLDMVDLPPEVLDALGQMVDTVLAEPEKYQEIRARFIQEGVPEDFLPVEFDAAFFGALNLALDQISANQEPEQPQGFENGGAVKKSPIAAGIAQLGRKGDSQLAHITMSEARMLRRRGGSGTINPRTGLREYFIDKVFKSVGNAIKSVGKSVSNAVKGVVNGVKKFAKSTVGRILTTVALGFFLGPAAASLVGVGAGSVVGTAISGFVGGFGSSLLAGDNIKTALRNGAIGGITAGAMSGVTGSSFYSPSTMTAGEALTGQFDKFTKGIGSLMGNAPAEAAPPSPVTAAAQETAMPQPIEPPQFTATAEPGVQVAGQAQGIGQVSGAPMQQTPADFMRSVEPRAMGQQLPPGATMTYQGGVTPSGTISPAATISPAPTPAPSGFLERAYEGVKGFFNPQADPAAVQDAYIKELGRRGALNMDITSDAVKEAAYKAAEKTAAPMFGATTRLVGTGILGLAATGGFKQEPPTSPGILPKETGQELLRKFPQMYAVTPGGAQVTYGGGQRFAQGGIAAVAPRRFNMGGFAGYSQGGGIGSKFPRRTGPINGPGTGTSDSIPAMLSDGEFVFTAKAVRGAGKGSRREGAKRMYAMMKALERKA